MKSGKTSSLYGATLLLYRDLGPVHIFFFYSPKTSQAQLWNLDVKSWYKNWLALF